MVYKGPFRQVIADDGTVFPRGERVFIAADRAKSLQGGEGAGQFLVLE